MACGTIPCGFPGYDGPAEFVTEDNGIWAEAPDADQIFETMQRTAALKPKSARVKALRAAGQEAVARYRAAAMTEPLIAFLVRSGAANTPGLNPRPPSPPGL